MLPPDPKDGWHEVEPLSDARWGRIKRSLFDQLDEEGLAAPEAASARRGRRLRSAARLVLAGAAAAAVGAIASRALWQAPPGRAMPSHIVTAESESHVALGGASLEVGPRSELDLSGDEDHGIRVHLDRGSVACEVAPRLGRPPFVVEAAGAIVRVVGTRFAVSRENDGVHVDVTKGVVEVEAHGDVHRVSAGDSWVVPPPPLASTVPSSVPQPPQALAMEPRSAARPPASSSATASHTYPGTPSANGPSASATEAPPPSSAASAPPESTFAARPFALPSAEPRRTPQERYEAAASLEPTEPAAAIAIYDDLAQGDGPWSANALFAEGRLQADRGAGDAARHLLERYLGRFPRGPNAADARDLLEDLARSKR